MRLSVQEVCFADLFEFFFFLFLVGERLSTLNCAYLTFTVYVLAESAVCESALGFRMNQYFTRTGIGLFGCIVMVNIVIILFSQAECNFLIWCRTRYTVCRLCDE